MPRDYEDIFELDDVNDGELRAIVRETIERHDGIDSASVVVNVSDGIVRLSGRVGTDGERQIADHLLSDVIGLTRYENNIVVDSLHRDEAPEAADDASAEAAESSGEPLGRPRRPLDDASADQEDELEARLYGSHDVTSAIEQGTAWAPPDSPTQEGYSERIGDEDLQDERPEQRP
ncbi:MAG TPA: BON domain-containing protein [Gemmatimonadaceae bacterium]|nr:BON domain-containing protein [Gemmatimonadaceae bacterium]